MTTTSRAGAPASVDLRKPALIIVGVLAVYFIFDSVVQYFTWTEEAYGYYWPFRLSLIVHVAGGLLALLAGLFQLWSGLNKTAMATHPLVGRVYVGAVLLGASGAVALSLTSAVYGFAWGVALVALAVAWVAITGTAVHCIRRRSIQTHKQWMIRSYILTFGFVSFRIVLDYVPYEALWGISRPEMANAAIWPVWVVPLIAYEILLAMRSVKAPVQ